jgi:cell division initiation protein
MSTISPNDILEKEFKKKLNGYDPSEVREFLEYVASYLSSLIKENNLLKSRVMAQKAQIEAYIRKEAELMNALVTAQKFSDDLKGQAEKEADFILQRSKLEAETLIIDAKKEYESILKNAKQDAEKLMRDSNRRLINMETRLTELKRLREENLFRLRSTLEWFNRMLIQEEKDFGTGDILDFSDINKSSKPDRFSDKNKNIKSEEKPQIDPSVNEIDNPLEEPEALVSEEKAAPLANSEIAEKKVLKNALDDIEDNEIMSWFDPVDKKDKDPFQ